MMESRMKRNFHVRFGERYEETRQLQGRKVRFVPTPLSPLLANIALNGIERIGEYESYYKVIPRCIRYADDMVYFLKPEDDAKQLLDEIEEFLAQRGMNVSQKKTKVTASTDGFDFLGWHFYIQKDNGKFRSVPSTENFKAFRKKVKNIINNSNYGAETKVSKLAPIVRGWRNYHKHCNMNGTKESLWFINDQTRKVFLKQESIDKKQAVNLVRRAFPTVSFSENRFVNVRGDKSPFDGDINYWSKRNSKLYDGTTAKTLRKQNHSCKQCGLKFLNEERIELHHIDGNHNNWESSNLSAIHRSCHQYLHMSKSES